MIGGIHVEVLLAAGYSAFLIAASAVLEWIARRSHQRSQTYQTAGFTYHQSLDIWKCPMGEHLLPAGISTETRIARYRAPANTCNSCILKDSCTDSDQGREILQHMDSWMQSELRRFHAGISFALLLLAVLIVIAEIPRHNQAAELAVLFLALAAAFWAGRQLPSKFRTRSIAPDH